MNINEQADAVRLAFDIAFLRALEQWTFELQQQNSNVRYVVAHARNEWNFSRRLRLDWSKNERR